MSSQEYVSAEKVRAALRSVYRNDPESSLQNALLPSPADELKPIDEKNRCKPNSLLVLVFVVVCALVGYFSTSLLEADESLF
jgi:urate oxidase